MCVPPFSKSIRSQKIDRRQIVSVRRFPRTFDGLSAATTTVRDTNAIEQQVTQAFRFPVADPGALCLAVSGDVRGRAAHGLVRSGLLRRRTRTPARSRRRRDRRLAAPRRGDGSLDRQPERSARDTLGSAQALDDRRNTPFPRRRVAGPRPRRAPRVRRIRRLVRAPVPGLHHDRACRSLCCEKGTPEC